MSNYEKVGDDIFNENHRLEPYYAAAYALYRLDFLFRNDGRFPSKYKPARFHVLLAARLLIDASEVPPSNSHKMERLAIKIRDALWGPDSDELLLRAIVVVDQVADSNMGRDHIRQKPITDALLIHFGLRPGPEG